MLKSDSSTHTRGSVFEMLLELPYAHASAPFARVRASFSGPDGIADAL